MKCIIDKTELQYAFDLGSLAISDFVITQPNNLEKFPLRLGFSPTSKLLQLIDKVDTNKMYGKYWYRSGTNDSMKTALKNIVDSVLKIYNGPKNGVWLDIASNDGTLLSYVPDSFYRCGIDPADNSFITESSKYGSIVKDYFSEISYNKTVPGLLQKKVNIITCIAMFYDLDNPIEFMQDINKVLDDDGIFVVQMSYTPLMVEQLAFDNICHEHVAYYTLESLKCILDKTGFQIKDVEMNDVNGGSFRVYIQKNIAQENSFGSAPQRDIGKARIAMMTVYEQEKRVNTLQYYLKFFENILNLKFSTFNLIKDLKNKGKTIWVYGASTKGNTLLQWFGLDKTLIDGAAERSPYKYGMHTIATDIPIYSEEYMRKVRPDYLLILPWHFIDEFKQREKQYLEGGGKFIVPCPKLEIISA